MFFSSLFLLLIAAVSHLLVPFAFNHYGVSFHMACTTYEMDCAWFLAR